MRYVPHRFTYLNIILKFMVLFEVVMEFLEYGTYQVSDREIINNWARGHTSNIFGKYSGCLCLSPKYLPEAESKINRMTSLLEEILRQHNIEPVEWLLITLTRICNRKVLAGQGKNIQFGEEKKTRKEANVTAKACA